jgi:hypothetical protein
MKHKEYPNKKCAVKKHSAWITAILRDSTSIPDELLLSRARFRFLMSAMKLVRVMYIYKLS